MSKEKDLEQQETVAQDQQAEGCQTAPEEPQTAPEEETAPEASVPSLEEVEGLKRDLAGWEEKFLRLAAEYDNFRKRSQKEKETTWSDAKAETVKAFLPVYDNLLRALKQETCDEAYAKGVEMTLTGLKEILSKLGVEEIPALGEPFDPNLHNAVMHIEDEAAGENTIVEVFETGFKAGEKIIRFAMVKVAN